MRDIREHDSAPPRRLTPIIALGLAVGLAVGACSGDSAGAEWTFTPTADAARPSPSEQVASTGSSASAEPADQFGSGRAQPLEPPAGNVIPRFVEPERADGPEAAEAEPAPIDIDPQAVTSSTGAEAVDPTPSASSGLGASAVPTSVPSAQASRPAVVQLSLVAQETSFDTDELTVNAGVTVRLTLENRDPIPHNVAIYQTDAADEAIFVGEIVSGPRATRTYEFKAPSEPGEYFFRCDLHPQLMTGTFVVE